MLPTPPAIAYRTRRAIAVVTTLLLAGLSVSCGDGPVSTEQEVPTLVFSTAARTVRVGQAVPLAGLLVDTRGVPVDAATLTWESSVPGVARVSQGGSVEGMAPGEADVRVLDGRRSATIRVVVTLVPVDSLRFEPLEGELFVGEEVPLTVAALDSAGNELHGRELRYTVSDSSVATVDDHGALRAVGQGNVTVVAEIGELRASQRVRVVTRTVARVQATPVEIRATIGDTVRLAVVIRDSRGDEMEPRPITFRTMDPTIAVVDAEGLVRAVGPGNTGIIVKVDDRPAVVTVDVLLPDVVDPWPVVSGPPQVIPTPPMTDAGDGSFTIAFSFVGDPDARAAALLERAAARWTAAITSDAVDITLKLPANLCFDGQPEIDQRVDDLLVLVRVADIDGPGKGLARAGPCLVRTASGIPLLGLVELDRADLGMDEQLLLDVVTHEVGHVLGIGTLWFYRALVHGRGGDDPVFQGEAALAAYEGMGASGFVPLENVGGGGTRDVHWRETTFRSELMTGYMNGGSNALSRLTIASLRDMGYGVNMNAAEPYTLPVQAGVSARLAAPTGTPVHDEPLAPRFGVDPDGRLRPLP